MKTVVPILGTLQQLPVLLDAISQLYRGIGQNRQKIHNDDNLILRIKELPFKLSGSRDKTVRVWDMSTGACVMMLEGHEDEVTSIAVSADGRKIVSGSRDKTVRVWHMLTDSEKSLTCHINSKSTTSNDENIISRDAMQGGQMTGTEKVQSAFKYPAGGAAVLNVLRSNKILCLEDNNNKSISNSYP